MTTAAVVVAAGRGERLGPGLPKALRSIGGKPLLVHAVSAMVGASSVDFVVVAAPPDDVGSVEAMLAPFAGGKAVRVVAGGATRQDSVAAALHALPDAVDVVLVHDAARPLAPSALADAVVARVHAGAGAVVPGIAVVDTVKQVDADGRVGRTVDRDSLRAIQTPQGFRRDVIERAHAAAQGSASDDAALVEALGEPVWVIPGHDDAFKVTRPQDFAVAEDVLARRRTGGEA